jgi:hypothetical protein
MRYLSRKGQCLDVACSTQLSKNDQARLMPGSPAGIHLQPNIGYASQCHAAMHLFGIVFLSAVLKLTQQLWPCQGGLSLFPRSVQSTQHRYDHPPEILGSRPWIHRSGSASHSPCSPRFPPEIPNLSISGQRWYSRIRRGRFRIRDLRFGAFARRQFRQCASHWMTRRMIRRVVTFLVTSMSCFDNAQAPIGKR